MLVHECKRSLRLWGNVNYFVIRIPVLGNSRLPFLDGLLCGILTGEDQSLFIAVLFLHIILDISRPIVFYGAVSPGDSQGIIKTIFLQGRIILVIIHLFITDLLHLQILCRINA